MSFVDINPFYIVIGVVIVLFVVIGGVRQSVISRRSKAALASPAATAKIRTTKGLNITDVDGHDLFVDEIDLTPGTHRVSFQRERVTLGHAVVDQLGALEIELKPGQLVTVDWYEPAGGGKVTLSYSETPLG